MFRIFIALTGDIIVCEVSFYVMEMLEGAVVILEATLLPADRNFLRSLYNGRVPFQNEFIFIVNAVFHCNANDKHGTHCSENFFCVHVLV
jgi:hypothetical protein